MTACDLAKISSAVISNAAPVVAAEAMGSAQPSKPRSIAGKVRGIGSSFSFGRASGARGLRIAAWRRLAGQPHWATRAQAYPLTERTRQGRRTLATWQCRRGISAPPINRPSGVQHRARATGRAFQTRSVQMPMPVPSFALGDNRTPVTTALVSFANERVGAAERALPEIIGQARSGRSDLRRAGALAFAGVVGVVG